LTNGEPVAIDTIGNFSEIDRNGELIFNPDRANLNIKATGKNIFVIEDESTTYTATLESGNLRIQGACQQ